MRASGGMTMRFSPPLYFTVTTCPSTPLTVSSTVALVIVPCGARPHGRKPSPRPRCCSENTVTRIARWLPSGFGVAPTPMNAPGLTSASVARAMPNTTAFFARCTMLVPPPSIARMVTSSPSTRSTVPVMRITFGAKGCANEAPPSSSTRRTMNRIAASHRGNDIPPHIHALGQDRAIALLFPSEDDDLRAGLELILFRLGRCGNHGLRCDHNLFFFVLILDHQRVAIRRGDGVDEEGVGHRAARTRIPRPRAFAAAAQGCRRDVDRERSNAAIGLRQTRDADEGVGFDVGERRFYERGDAGGVVDLDVQHRAVARLYRQHRAVGFDDFATDTAGLLRRGNRYGHQQSGGRAKCADAGVQAEHDLLPEGCAVRTALSGGEPLGFFLIPASLHFSFAVGRSRLWRDGRLC